MGLFAGDGQRCITNQDMDLLECIQPLLPTSITLDSNLDTSKNHLLSATEINSELNDVTVLYPERLRLDVRLAQPYVVEERARRALDILDVPIAVLAPQLAVFSADYLAFESNRSSRGHIGWDIWDIVAL